jgi:hypothetical protein
MAGGPKGLTVQERFLWHLNNDSFGDANDAMQKAEADMSGLGELRTRQTGRMLVPGHTALAGSAPMAPEVQAPPASSVVPPGYQPPPGMTIEMANRLRGAADYAKIKRLVVGYADGKRKYPASGPDMRASFIRKYGVDPEWDLLAGGF